MTTETLSIPSAAQLAELRMTVIFTEYEGNDFAAAARFGEYVRDELEVVFPEYAISVTSGRKAAVFVYGPDAAVNAEIGAEVLPMLEETLWDSFVNYAWKSYQ